MSIRPTGCLQIATNGDVAINLRWATTREFILVQCMPIPDLRFAFAYTTGFVITQLGRGHTISRPGRITYVFADLRGCGVRATFRRPKGRRPSPCRSPPLEVEAICEHEFMFINIRLLLYGLVIWMSATAALRIFGQHILRPANPVSIVILFSVSLPLMALLVRRLCRTVRLPTDQWILGAASVALPTLLLDPFSTAFFSSMYPNMAPEAAGLFGGWILWCCCGALLGGMIRLRK